MNETTTVTVKNVPKELWQEIKMQALIKGQTLEAWAIAAFRKASKRAK
jgi:hypothetical protein